jgi:alpha-glucosidase
MPICRPLFLNDPKDNALYNRPQLDRLSDQFFVGRDLLVAPVIERETDSGGKRDVYLPAGSRWYSFEANYNDKVLPLAKAAQGGVLIRGFDASIDGMKYDKNRISFLCPIYVREGAVIPTILVEQYVGELNALNKPNPITFNIYPGPSGSYTTYLDDGVSRSSAPADAPQFMFGDEAGIAKSEYRKTHLKHNCWDSRFRVITVERLHDNYTPKYEDHFYVALLHDPDESISTGASGPLLGVSIGGVEAMEVGDRGTLKGASKAAWWYDSKARISYIKVPDDRALIEIQARYDAPVPWDT